MWLNQSLNMELIFGFESWGQVSTNLPYPQMLPVDDRSKMPLNLGIGY
jgi:hypothetical protein